MNYAKILDKQIDALNVVLDKMGGVVVYDTNRLGVENLSTNYMNSYVVFCDTMTKLIETRLKCEDHGYTCDEEEFYVEEKKERRTSVSYNHDAIDSEVAPDIVNSDYMNAMNENFQQAMENAQAPSEEVVEESVDGSPDEVSEEPAEEVSEEVESSEES